MDKNEEGSRMRSTIVVLGIILICLVQVASGLCEEQRIGVSPSRASGATDIIHYDALLMPDFSKNAMSTRVRCTLHNKGLNEVKQLDFDILAAETFYDVQVSITGISQKRGEKSIAQDFTHRVQGKGDDPSSSGTKDAPKIVEVTLSPALKPDGVVEVVFEYTWHVVDPTRQNINYRLFATLPNGEKEVCLLSDFTWLPKLMDIPHEELRRMYDANWFPKEAKPTWQVSILAPPEYVAVVLDGWHVGSEKSAEQTVSKWESYVPGFPQVMVGHFERIAIEKPEVSVVFFVPKGPCEREVVESCGDFLARAYAFYSKLYGPLQAKEIHIGASSANQGGHGAYAGMTLDAETFQKKMPDLNMKCFFTELVAHELAHSWWGHSVSSYGRGTKFLRESLAQFSCWYLAQEFFRMDRFAENMAYVFWTGMHTSRLFFPDSDDGNKAYYKGPLVLNILRSEMGDEPFFRTLKTFANRYSNGHATFSDFVATCNDVSGSDWTEFFNQWCFAGECPDYHLIRFESQQQDGAWRTVVTIRNDGKATITCPLELQMAEGAREGKFRMAGGMTSTFTYETPNKVLKVVIDPQHNTYQGSGEERRLKMLSVGETEWEWIHYWRGVVYAELGAYEKAIEDISRAMDSHGHPGFSYSRGVTYLLMGDKDRATADLRSFIDTLLGDPQIIRTTAYAGIIASSEGQREADLHEILRSLTGQDFKLDSNVEANEFKGEWERCVKQWQEWWKTNRGSFRLAESARSLAPGGVKKPESETTLIEKIEKIPWTGGGDDAVRLFSKARELKLREGDAWFKLGMTLYDGGHYEKALDAFRYTSEHEKSPGLHFTAIVWQGHLLDLFGQREDALRCYDQASKHEALKRDPTYECQHAQYHMRINRQWVEERLKTPFTKEMTGK
jgi:tetratricopeptide (TPR) repeat protein